MGPFQVGVGSATLVSDPDDAPAPAADVIAVERGVIAEHYLRVERPQPDAGAATHVRSART
jgi:hypothetical protein